MDWMDVLFFAGCVAGGLGLFFAGLGYLTDVIAKRRDRRKVP